MKLNEEIKSLNITELIKAKHFFSVIQTCNKIFTLFQKYIKLFELKKNKNKETYL